jgi:hypothetical protein
MCILHAGLDLPSFAFDYSEFIASAVIERSTESDDLYLNIFFVGHRSIFNNFPFETISTDEEVLHKWGQAIKKWKLENSRYNHEIQKRSIKKSGHQHHPPHLNHALSCALHNNEENNSPPYVSSGHWISSDYLPDHVHGNFEVLRCKLKGIYHFYDSLVHSDHHLSVDILSRGSRYSHNSTAVEHQDVIMSFYVPWRTRIAGYGLGFTADSSKLDPWAGINASSTSQSTVSLPPKISKVTPKPSKKVMLCASDFQQSSNTAAVPGIEIGM